jgi:hypothetical protein
MFSDKKGQNQNPLTTSPKSAHVMGHGSTNANIDRKGTFKGTTKKTTNVNTKKKTSPSAATGSFGKATKIASGKMNFSKGAPGHERGVIK